MDRVNTIDTPLLRSMLMDILALLKGLDTSSNLIVETDSFEIKLPQLSMNIYVNHSMHYDILRSSENNDVCLKDLNLAQVRTLLLELR